MSTVYFSKEKKLSFKARINEESVPVVFTFQNEDETAHSIAAYGFKLRVSKKPYSGTLFELEDGDGLTISGAGDNVLTIQLSDVQAKQRPGYYFARLFSNDVNTWISAPFEFYEGVVETETSEETITITENGTPVTITITSVSSGGSVDGSLVILDPVTLPVTTGTAAFPSTGGTGSSGAIVKGNAFPVASPGGFVPGVDEAQFCPQGTILIALVDTPGQTVTNWRQL